MEKKNVPKNQRSDVKNPNNIAYKADAENRSKMKDQNDHVSPIESGKKTTVINQSKVKKK